MTKNIENFVKYPKIPYIDETSNIFGHEGYIFEKIDGSLTQVRKIEGNLVGGSKANYLGKARAIKSPWMSDFLKWMYSNHSLHNIPENIIMYGEWLEPITVEYYQENLKKFYFIDLGFVEGKKPVFYDYEEARNYLNQWCIKDVVVLDPIKKEFFDYNSVINDLENYHGKLGPEIEGIVLKNYKLQLFAKSLNQKYSEIRRQAQTLEKKYVNRPRINKSIRRLRDLGKEPLIDNIVNDVIRDINEESHISFDPIAVRSLIRLHNYVRNTRKNDPFLLKT